MPLWLSKGVHWSQAPKNSRFAENCAWWCDSASDAIKMIIWHNYILQFSACQQLNQNCIITDTENVDFCEICTDNVLTITINCDILISSGMISDDISTYANPGKSIYILTLFVAHQPRIHQVSAEIPLIREAAKCETPSKRLHWTTSGVGNIFAKELKLSSPAVSVEE